MEDIASIRRDKILCLYLGHRGLLVFSKVGEDLVACQQFTVVAVDAGCTVRLVGERGTLRSFQLAMVRAKAFGNGDNFFHEQPESLFVEEFAGPVALGEDLDL